MGTQGWFESSSRISHKVHSVLPWRRTALSYDDDFGRPIGVALLPGYAALTEGQVRYLVTGRATDDTIGTADMPEAGGAVVLAFGRTDLSGLALLGGVCLGYRAVGGVVEKCAIVPCMAPFAAR